jgi:hypothetical protein
VKSARPGGKPKLPGERIKQAQTAARNQKVKVVGTDVAADVGRHNNHPFPHKGPVRLASAAVLKAAVKRQLITRTALIGRLSGHKTVSQIRVARVYPGNHVPASKGSTAVAAASVLVARRHQLILPVALFTRCADGVLPAALPGTALFATIPIAGHPAPRLRVRAGDKENGKQRNRKERLLHTLSSLSINKFLHPKLNRGVSPR